MPRQTEIGSLRDDVHISLEAAQVGLEREEDVAGVAGVHAEDDDLLSILGYTSRTR